MAAGFGSGLVYRVGGTTGGTDVIARIFENTLGLAWAARCYFLMLQSYLSLTYIDVKRMMYTLIVSFVFSRVVDSVLDGAYARKEF